MDFTFMGTFTLGFSPDDPINIELQFCSRSLVKETEPCVSKPNRVIAETREAV